MKKYFSVLLPTKNRSFLVGYAIKSVLAQTFKDFEMIIADNDDSDDTRKIVSTFDDPRIRYYRSGGLSMPDNWEFCASKAEGEYLTVLEDKGALKPKAFERIYSQVERERDLVVSWHYETLDDSYTPPRLYRMTGQKGCENILSDNIISTFVNKGRKPVLQQIPRGLNSCIHQKLAEKIRYGCTKRLFMPMSPDYTFAFQQLALVDSILHFNEAFVVLGGFKYSTGKQTKVKGDALWQYIRDMGGAEKFFDYIPLKTITVSSAIFNDYERIRTLVGGRLVNHPINLVTLFISSYKDINGSKVNTDMSEEEEAWHHALNEQDESIKTKVRSILFDQPQTPAAPPSPAFMDYAKRCYHAARSRISGLLPKIHTAPAAVALPEFDNVLEYIAWEEQQGDGQRG